MSSKRRSLRPEEIALLIKNGNEAADWAALSVANDFNPERVKQCQFHGQISIGTLRSDWIERDGLSLPGGLSNTFFYNCEIGDDVAIHQIGLIRNAEIKNRVILFKVGEIIGTASNGEIRIDVINENGRRCIYPFPGMLTADAWLWSKSRDDEKCLQSFYKLARTAQSEGCTKEGLRTIIGSDSIIVHSHVLRDVRAGAAARIRGAGNLNNVVLKSSSQYPTHVGEGCVLTNGIVGLNCRINGTQASNFFLGSNSSMESGVRLFDSYVGPNSHLSCCEVRNALIFGRHSQHHTSFFCAGVIKGMSNIPAGAVIGSNHNSRAADGEIVADRGFWPGLNVSLKHNSRFAAFTILAKGNYPMELNIELPFCLVVNDESAGELKLLPGYWFRHNLYALTRNSMKSRLRSKGADDVMQIEHDWLAPDTVEQMLHARKVLENWAQENASGIDMLASEDNDLIAPCNQVEAGKRTVRILHAGRAWRDYGRMIRYYAVRTILFFNGDLDALRSAVNSGQTFSWVNLGDQMVPESRLNYLKKNILSGNIASIDALHDAYREIEEIIPDEHLEYACNLLHLRRDTENNYSLDNLIKEALETADFIRNGVRESRLKDYENPFRNTVYDSIQERDAVLGRFEDDEVVAESEKLYEDFYKKIKICRRGT